MTTPRQFGDEHNPVKVPIASTTTASMTETRDGAQMMNIVTLSLTSLDHHDTQVVDNFAIPVNAAVELAQSILHAARICQGHSS